MNSHKIAIVNSSSFGKIFPNHIDRLNKIGTVSYFNFDSSITGKDLANELNEFDMVIASVTPFFDKEFFSLKKDLKLISRHGIGYNNIDIEAAKNVGTIVSIIPALVERDAVAENNITNLLNIMRKTTLAQKSVENDCWEERASFIGHSLYHKTVGILGIGNTGSGVAETLRNGFKCRVLAYDPFKDQLEVEQFGAEKVTFDYLLSNSDVICICANLTEENYHFIDEKAVSLMKTGVYISNSARGALVSESAIIRGVEQGKIAGYATDVLETEPGRSSHIFMNNDKIIVTPHTSAYTMECLEAMGEKCVQDCEKVSRGEIPVRSVQDQSFWINSKT
ncbi:D-isomer specific 2-hydroxyacid dehydrogenase family protein [Streptococcus parauberis]|uniref:D-isomer specific 2-hydroxyacid dehydrogenase family protein n=1 Tax=Streptococcus parauberis TaxID=1348 RepID=UPI000CCEA362|nr:D-isomer specific 2-hydroxyacid dehydrogenase family protein [Streptococcus parauberis]PNY18370.1 D-3-phosphoglycerate dehydrogenase [Streptococcus parauberis]